MVGRGVTPLMTERVRQCRGATAADADYVQSVMGGEGEQGGGGREC